MTETWTAYTTARELVKFLPMFGRTIGKQMRDAGEEEGTLIQVLALTQLEDQRFTISGLAKRRQVSLQSASTLVQRLVERGWVVRAPDPNDRRQTLVQLTPEGMAHAEATFEQIVSSLAAYLEPLTPDELDAAQVFLNALKRVMHPTSTPTLER